MKGKERWKRIFGIALIGIVLVGVISPALALTQVMDFDYNDDGVVDDEDVRLIFVQMYFEPYDRKYDNNYDGVINMTDILLTYNRSEAGYNLTEIWNNIYRGETYITIDNKSFRVIKCNRTAVTISTDFETTPNYYDWLDIDYHPYINDEYVCLEFAFDLFLSSYQDFGYGVIFPAVSETHAYNVIWTGGDFYDANNWHIIEPQTGGWMGWVGYWNGYGGIYDTRSILFPYSIIRFNNKTQINCYEFIVGEDDRLHLGKTFGTTLNCEELPYISGFDTDG